MRSTPCSFGNEPSTATSEIHAFARSGAFATAKHRFQGVECVVELGVWRHSKRWAKGAHNLGEPSREGDLEVTHCRS